MNIKVEINMNNFPIKDRVTVNLQIKLTKIFHFQPKNIREEKSIP